MNVKKVEQIQELINKAEIESAKAEGQIQSLKQEWKKVYGTDDVEEIKNKLQELTSELQKTQDRLKVLYDKLLSCYDWDNLEEELS